MITAMAIIGSSAMIGAIGLFVVEHVLIDAYQNRSEERWESSCRELSETCSTCTLGVWSKSEIDARVRDWADTGI